MKMIQKIGRGRGLLGEVERVLILPPEDPFFYIYIYIYIPTMYFFCARQFIFIYLAFFFLAAQ